MGQRALEKILGKNPGLHTVLLLGLLHGSRVRKLKKLLAEKRFDAIVGFSSGASVLADLERLGLIPESTIPVYAAPAPQPGVKFDVRERAFEKILGYFPKMLLSLKILLSKYDFLPLFEGKKDVEIVADLEPESSWFMLGQVFRQLFPVKALPDNPNRVIVRSIGDYLLGSTQTRTVMILNSRRHIYATVQGHYGPMLELEDILWTIK